MSDIQDVSIKCNLLLIGKTGAGKSSFANYLFGVDKFTTGTGAPVTKWEENFQQFSLDIYKENTTPSSHKISIIQRIFKFFTKIFSKRVSKKDSKVSVAQVNVYDSVGLESNNYDKWMGELKQFLSEKQVISGSKVLPANEIIHVCFYVINGAGARIESNELEIINTICKTHKIPVSVIVTNCDTASESQISKLEKIINEKWIESIRVCSVSKKTRSGEKKEPFGKDSALKKVLAASYEKVGKELSSITYQRFILFMCDVKRKCIKKINDSKISVFKLDEADIAMNKIFSEMDEMLNGLHDKKDILPPAYYSYYNFIENFHVEFQGRNIFEESFDEIENFDIDVENMGLVRKMDKAIENIEEGNFFEKAVAVFSMGWTVLFLKKNIIKLVTQSFDEIVAKLYIQLWKIKGA